MMEMKSKDWSSDGWVIENTAIAAWVSGRSSPSHSSRNISFQIGIFSS